MVKKKTWSRKNIVFVCGYCTMCKRQLLNTMGGWIINGENKHFCHPYNGKESCFDKYIKGEHNAGTLRKENEKTF